MLAFYSILPDETPILLAATRPGSELTVGGRAVTLDMSHLPKGNCQVLLTGDVAGRGVQALIPCRAGGSLSLGVLPAGDFSVVVVRGPDVLATAQLPEVGGTVALTPEPVGK